MDDRTNLWETYDTDTNNQISKLNKNENKLSLLINSRKYNIITVNRNNGYQINTTTNFKRKIRRVTKYAIFFVLDDFSQKF